MKMLKFATVLTAFAIMCCSQNVYSNDEKFGHGLNPMTEEQKKDIEENWRHVIDVKPNKIGLERIQKHRKHLGLEPLVMEPAGHHEEFVFEKGIHNHPRATEASAATTLPTSVDNSTLPCFPPIGNQGGLGACVAFAVGYYQATHEYGLLNALNNKGSPNNIASPKWVYNLGSTGNNTGMFIVTAHNLLAENGFVLNSQFPYDNNYTAWDLNAQDWVNALSRRLQPAFSVTGLNSVPQDLTSIKQTLVNGHVLNFGTCIDAWVGGVVGTDPSQPSNPYAGQQAAICQNGCAGPHAMTIVGYDDNVWIDINGNGVVDPGELGAFLVANQWGPGYGNKGFIWIAYDAFLAKSAVVNGPAAPNRTPLAGYSGSLLTGTVPLAQNYTPKLVGQITLSQNTRNQIAALAGVSDQTSTQPTKNSSMYMLKNQAGALEFDGTPPAAQQTATFAVDFTDLLPAVDGTPQRYYFTVSDNVAGNPTTIDAFTLVDNVSEQTVPCTAIALPVSVDNASTLVYIDYTFTDIPPTLLPLTITSPKNGSIQKRTCVVTGVPQAGSGPISKVEVYLDSKLMTTLTAPPYTTTLTGVNNWPKGNHVITMTAYDSIGRTASSSVTVITN